MSNLRENEGRCTKTCNLYMKLFFWPKKLLIGCKNWLLIITLFSVLSFSDFIWSIVFLSWSSECWHRELAEEEDWPGCREVGGCERCQQDDRERWCCYHWILQGRLKLLFSGTDKEGIWWYLCPPLKGSGTYCFGADPVDVGVSVTLTCLHDISWTGGWILTRFARV